MKRLEYSSTLLVRRSMASSPIGLSVSGGPKRELTSCTNSSLWAVVGKLPPTPLAAAVAKFVVARRSGRSAPQPDGEPPRLVQVDGWLGLARRSPTPRPGLAGAAGAPS
jgi:hypothetical protein